MNTKYFLITYRAISIYNYVIWGDVAYSTKSCYVNRKIIQQVVKDDVTGINGNIVITNIIELTKEQHDEYVR